MSKENQRGRSLRVQVAGRLSDVRPDDSVPSLYAYLFSASGDVLDRKPLDKAGKAVLEMEASEERRSVRVMIGPETGAESGIYSEMSRRGAIERPMVHDLNKDLIAEFEIDRGDWLRWILGRCCVKGRVLKRIGSGSSAVDLNVCEATVEIFEVDPWWIIIDRLPNDILGRLRDIVLEEVPRVPKPLPPDPGPMIWPPDPIPWFEEALFKKSSRKKVASAKTAFPEEVLNSARIHSDLAFKQVISRYADLFYPLFCWHWPWFVHKTKVCETVTDCYGKFTCCFYHGWFNPDTPDLWFRVRQVINGVDTVIYQKYPVACHTYWNYVCGTEVKLYVTNPEARTCCNEPPIEADGNWVILEAIGSLSPHLIRGSSLDAGTSVAGDGHDKGWTRDNGPFGGLIRPRIRFRDTLRPLGVKYYRVSFAPAGTDPANLAAWTIMDRPVARHFVHDVGGHPTYGTWDVGPKNVGLITNLFEIPPSAPPVGDWAIPPGYEYDDLTNAYFDTYANVPPASAGKFDLKVELFDNAGAMVNLAAKGIKWFVPSIDNLAGTIFTDDASDPGLNMVVGNAFVMTLHIDNNVCTAIIAPPTIGGNGADPNCGGLSYLSLADNVVLGFEASHPNQFATYSFNAYRGHANLVASDAGPVGAGLQNVTKSVSELLGTCRSAAFSENLWVYASATDGWRRLHEYDRGDVFAFMLVPGGPVLTP